MSKNLLLEIGTEEMPANIMSGVVDQLRVLAENAFGENRISLRKSPFMQHREDSQSSSRKLLTASLMKK